MEYKAAAIKKYTTAIITAENDSLTTKLIR